MVKVLYEETQGITDLAVKAYMLAQERAIETKKELVNASIIRSVCRDKFKIIRPALEALRFKTKSALTRFEDAYPQFLEQFINDSVKPDSTSKPPQIEGEISNDPQIRNILNNNKPPKNTKKSLPKPEDISTNENNSDSLTNLEDWLKKISKKALPPDSSSDKKALLPSILDALEVKTNKSIHAALNEAGFIRSGNEFISGGKSL